MDYLFDPARTESVAGCGLSGATQAGTVAPRDDLPVIILFTAIGDAVYKHLRIESKRYGRYDSRSKIKGLVDFDARPAIVETRTRIGDWECDALICRGRSNEHAGAHGQMHSITFDNGLEFAEHAKIGAGLKADIYFAHPYFLGAKDT